MEMILRTLPCIIRNNSKAAVAEKLIKKGGSNNKTIAKAAEFVKTSPKSKDKVELPAEFKGVNTGQTQI